MDHGYHRQVQRETLERDHPERMALHRRLLLAVGPGRLELGRLIRIFECCEVVSLELASNDASARLVAAVSERLPGEAVDQQVVAVREIPAARDRRRGHRPHPLDLPKPHQRDAADRRDHHNDDESCRHIPTLLNPGAAQPSGRVKASALWQLVRWPGFGRIAGA